LGLALDEPRANDEVNESGGYTFVMEKGLAQYAAPVVIDYNAWGFNIRSGAPAGDCGSCSSC